MGLIEQLNKRLAKRDRAGALELLLATWAHTPSIAVADAIDAVGSAGDERGLEIRAILGRTMAETVTRLRRALKWRDPRLTHVLAELLRTLPWAGAKSRDTWREVFEVIAKHGDPRFIAIAKTLPATWTVGKDLQKWLGNQLAAAVARIPIVQVVADEAALAKLATTLRAQVPPPAATPRNTESLLAAIYANPTDDAPRLVYADWLQERGDPRGEFIALQLAGTKTKRETELLKLHKKGWLGPLAGVLRGDVEFRRGFPAAGTVTFRHQRDAEQFGNLTEWATFERLEYSHTVVRNDQKIWAHYLGPAHAHLRIAIHPAIEHLLAAKAPWALERVDLDCRELDNVDHAPIERLLTSGLLPKLTSFGLTSWGAHPTWIANITTLPETFAISGGLADNEIVPWTKALASNKRCTTFEIRQYGGLLHRITRDARGSFTRLATVITPPTNAKTLAAAEYTLGIYREGLTALRGKLLHLDATATIEIAGAYVSV